MNLLFIRFFLLAGLLAGIIPAFAQLNSPLSFELNTIRPESEIKGLGGFQLIFPVLLSGKNQIIFSPQYKFIKTEDTLPLEDSRFYQGNARFVWRHKINASWNTTLLASSSLASASGNFSSNGLMHFTGIRFTHVQNPNFLYYFGMGYSYRFSNHIILPILGINWKPATRFNFSGNLPFRGQFMWKPKSNLKTGIVFSSERFTSYIPDSPDYDYFWFRERNIGWQGSIKTFGNFWFSTELGYSLKRNFNVYTKPENAKWSFAAQYVRPQEDAIFEHTEKGFYLKVGIAYRLQGKKFDL